MPPIHRARGRETSRAPVLAKANAGVVFAEHRRRIVRPQETAPAAIRRENTFAGPFPVADATRVFRQRGLAQASTDNPWRSPKAGNQAAGVSPSANRPESNNSGR